MWAPISNCGSSKSSSGRKAGKAALAPATAVSDREKHWWRTASRCLRWTQVSRRSGGKGARGGHSCGSQSGGNQAIVRSGRLMSFVRAAIHSSASKWSSVSPVLSDISMVACESAIPLWGWWLCRTELVTRLVPDTGEHGGWTTSSAEMIFLQRWS